MDNLPYFQISGDVKRALSLGLPVVALETTVVTHGLPSPYNLSLARDMEAAVRDEGATPATVGVIEGIVRVGLSDLDLETLAEGDALKISRRDFAEAIVEKANGGATVAGTMFAAHKAGIKVFATGGIGGVHRESNFDISPDMQALASTPMIVVCAGAKSILDLPATLEYLETMGVPVLGYNTEEFPAFYSRHSGLPVSAEVESPQEAVEFARVHWDLGLTSAVLVCQPLPEQDEIPRSVMDPIEEIASQQAVAHDISGQALTPFLLQLVNQLTSGKSMRANLTLLLNNARLAAQIARAMPSPRKVKAV
ncbi:MAG: pseudouridine-5'-phosphate glycosidase [Chloroflexota bacterium]